MKLSSRAYYSIQQYTNKQMLNQSLQTFEVPLEEALLLQQHPQQLATSQQRQIRFLYLNICLGWVTLIMFSVVSFEMPTQFINVLGFQVSWMLISCVWGYCSRHVTFFSFVNWISISLHLLLYWVYTLTAEYHFFLCGSATIIILFTLFEIFIRGKILLFKFYVYLYVTYVLVVSYDEEIQPSWALMVTLDIYVLVAVIVALRIAFKWTQLKNIDKFKYIMSVWLISVALMLCLSGSFYGAIRWEYFSVVPHFAFAAVTAYMYHHRQVLIKRYVQLEQILYFQISEVLLCDDKDYLGSPRQGSKGGKPLEMCISCYSEPATLIYSQCKHACICKVCSIQWLKKSIKTCPLCRVESNTLVEVERKHGIVFRAVALYRFRD